MVDFAQKQPFIALEIRLFMCYNESEKKKKGLSPMAQ